MAEKFSSTIRGASLIVVAIGVFGKGFGFLREIVFAAYFGLSADFDFYLIAVALPIILNTSIGYIIQNYFIPKFNQSRKISTEGAIILLNATMKKAILFSIITTVVLFFTGKFLLENLFGNVSETILALFQLSLILIPISTAISLLIAHQYADKKFVEASASLVFPNVVILFCVVSLTKIYGIYSILIGMIGGYALQLIYLLFKTKLKFSVRNSSAAILSTDNGAKNILIYVIIIEIISQLYILIDRYFYPQLKEGGIAALNYASTIFQLPIALIAMAFSTVLFPQFANLFAEEKIAELREQFLRSVSFTFFLFVPIAFIYFFDGDIVIKVLLERGEFGTADSIFTLPLLRALSISLIFYAVYAIFNKMIYGINGVKILFAITLMGLFLKLILNFYLVTHFLEEGLAISTTLSYIFFTFAALIYIRQKIKIEFAALLRECFIALISCFAIFGSINIFLTAVELNSIFMRVCGMFFSFGLYLFVSKLLEQEYFGLIQRTFVFKR